MKKPSKIVSKHPNIIKAFNAIPLDEQPQVLVELANHHDYNRVSKLNDLQKEILKLKGGAAMVAKAKKNAAQFVKDVEKQVRRKPKPTHRSKKDRKLTWTGRGSMPRWMRAEMKELKLKPDGFLIAKKK
ncbi:MAG: H-NS histone family protein [Prosthecobacter sp.]|nr:H-NS histone family protein [Prosthecobacter sp.]